jgi:Response regulator receiver domain
MASSEHAPQASEATRRRVILVVEDELLVRLTIPDYLRDAGYAVVEAANATEALEIFASGEPVDAVFTDVEMPDAMNGLMLKCWSPPERVMPPFALGSYLTTLSFRSRTRWRKWRVASTHYSHEGIDMSGRRPVIKGYFAALRLIFGSRI